jgi:hypothetical protein
MRTINSQVDTREIIIKRCHENRRSNLYTHIDGFQLYNESHEQ